MRLARASITLKNTATGTETKVTALVDSGALHGRYGLVLRFASTCAQQKTTRFLFFYN
jgi:hypothetical protein